jgi:UDP-N-acetylmuramate--alanine ligase
MGDELAATFANGLRPGDRLYLPDPVYQGGTVDRSRGSDWLVEKIGGGAQHVPEREAIARAILAEATAGDRVVIMGARDDTLSEFAAEIVHNLAR